ncbi:hypothetical protein SPCG_0528 [Streptococcus pneumoniae CGSP14]|nr:hypothetical protein SPCG_0528 [Streptococcus pneumoniae CGSP14]
MLRKTVFATSLPRFLSDLLPQNSWMKRDILKINCLPNLFHGRWISARLSLSGQACRYEGQFHQKSEEEGWQELSCQIKSKQNVSFYESVLWRMLRISLTMLVCQRSPIQQVFLQSRPWKMRFIIWSTFFRSVIKRKISQQATGLSSKERIRSLALSISTIAMKMMCWKSAIPYTQTIGGEVMCQKLRVP